MSNANLIEQLRELSTLKRRMLDNFDLRNEIQEAQKKKLDESIEVYLEKREAFEENKAIALSELMPKANDIAEDLIPSCDVKELKPVSAIVGLVFYVCLILFLISFVGIQFPIWLAFLIVPGVLVGGFMWLVKNGDISKYYDWKSKSEAWHKKYASAAVNRENMAREYQNFEKKFVKSAAELKAFVDAEEAKLEVKRAEIAEADEERIAEINASLEADYAKVKSIGLVHEDYFHLLEKIIENLETGRADDLKEALNIAIDESQKMEYEAIRIEEASRQEEILREQAYQNMLHNKEMERIEQKRAEDARIHAAQMEAHAKKQAEETRRLRQEMQRQGRR